MCNQSAIQNPQSKIQNGFTLIELLVVMVIISIILVFIVNAGIDARRRAEERATQGLIAKLEMGLSDRLESLLLTRPDYNNAHLAMAAIANNNAPLPIQGYLRASVIAWYDYVKSEMPDVFFVQNTTGPYPLNFAAYPYPGTPTDPNSLGNYILPLGNSIAATGSMLPLGAGNVFNPAGTGIYGASYPAAAGLYKNLGYLPAGYDGVDNGGIVGLVDDWQEGVNGTNQALVQANLASHKHVTARSEMLYALLVEGRGPLGSIFNRDDFTDREVQDTDQDGLPEFVDAWGQPLQFFRWPLLYHSDIQRGQLDRPDQQSEREYPYQLDTLFSLPDRLSGARAGPAGPQPAIGGAGVVVEQLQQRIDPGPDQYGEPGERERERPGVRVLLPPAHRTATPTTGGPNLLGSRRDLRRPPGVLLQVLDRLRGSGWATRRLPVLGQCYASFRD